MAKVKTRKKTKRKGPNGRAKGHAFERWVAIEVRKVWPSAKRHLEYQACEAQGVDLDNTGDFLIQCKRGRKYAPIGKIKEIQICPIEGGIPLLITKGDDVEPMACLPLNEFLKILLALKGKTR